MTPEEKQKQLRLRMKMEEEEAAGHGGPISIEAGANQRPGIHGGGPAPDFATEVPEGDIHNFQPVGMDASEAYARGFGQGATFGYGDELQGVVGATGLLDKERTPWQQQVDADLGPAPAPTAAERYRTARDADRANNAEAEREQGGAYLGGNLVGAVAVPVPGPGKASALGRGAKAAVNIAKAAGIGGLAGLGTSNADVTRGDVAGAAKDTAVGAGVGAGVGAAGELLGLLGQLFSGKASKAEAEALQKQVAALAKKENRAAGALGGATSGGTHSDDILSKIIADPRATPEQVAAAKQLLENPESTELVRGVYDNALKNHPRKLGALKSAATALEEAQAANTPEAAQAAAEKATSLGTAFGKTWDRAFNYGGRAAGAALGGLIGGVPGALVGGAVGGNPGTALGNLLKDPSVRKNGFKALQYGLTAAPSLLARQTGLPAAVAQQVVEALSKEEEPVFVSPEDYGSPTP